jgi:hypothetical protein
VNWKQSRARSTAYRALVKARVEAERRAGLGSGPKRALARLAPSRLPWLAAVYGSDKGVTAHRYVDVYAEHLGAIRRDVTKVLEIGIYKGASLQMWRDYFPNAEVYGLDINEVHVDGPRITTLQGDQASPEVHERLRALGPFDLIVDDGSHKAEHILATFAGLFEAVAPGGWYVIEDMQTAYAAKGYGGGPPGHPDTAATLVKHLVDAVNHEAIARQHPAVALGIEQVSALHVYPRVALIQRAPEARA